MFIEDQDEDVEEEEEFHEVEEEKHKTSQESVGSNSVAAVAGGSKVSASPKSNKTSTSSSSSKPSPTSSKASPSKSIATNAPLHQLDLEKLVEQDQTRDYEAVVDLSTGQALSKTESDSNQTLEPADVSNTTSETISNLEEVSSDKIAVDHAVLSDEVTSTSTAITDGPTSNCKSDASKSAPNKAEADAQSELSSAESAATPTTTSDTTISQNPDSKAVDTSIKLDDIVTGMAELAVAEECENRETAEVACDIESSSMATTEVAADNKSQNAKNADWTDIMLSSNIQDQDDQSESSPNENEKSEEKEADPEKKELDLDEDVKNPQYIPKKGVFYEHDDRSHDANVKKQPSTSAKKDEETVEVKESVDNKKPNIQEKSGDNKRGGRRQRTDGDRWNHDLFRDEKQKPKSKSELINAYGYDIRHERSSRNQAETRPSRGANSSNVAERQAGNQENQRQRPRDGRVRRQSQTANRSRERRPRRQNNRNRNDTSGTPSRRDVQNTSRPNKTESKDPKSETVDGTQGFQTSHTQPMSTVTVAKRDYQQQDIARERGNRNDNRGRRQNSNDRPTTNSVDDKLPPINTVMPPITTWSNKIEDMVKEEASRKESPSRHQQQQPQAMNSNAKGRPNDYWPQNQPNKAMYQDRSSRNLDDNRQQQQQHYNQRRYNQDREDPSKQNQFVGRNQYNDRSNQHHQEWRRTNHYNAYAKSNDYEPIKTQTFENSRLSQATNMNRYNFRDAREIINERRMQSQQNMQSKVQPGLEHQLHQRHQQHPQAQQHSPQGHQQLVQQQHQQQQLLQHQQMMVQQQHHQHQNSQHIRQQQQQPLLQQPQQPPTSQQQAPATAQNLNHQQSQPQSQPSAPQMQGQRQPQSSPQQHPSQPLQSQSRQNLVASSMGDGVQEAGRLSVNNAAASDPINSRPIIKTDAYTGTTIGPLSQPLQQHSQNHRSLSGPMGQQGPANSAASHLLPSHLGASGTQAQYYSPAGGSRDSAAAAAALASAYHGYMTGGHSVIDASRYHMTSQPLSDHGYMPSPGQANDVAAASVLHQQGMYADAASTGGTVASSAYLAQAGSTISPSSNIPVTGAGPPPLPPVSYLQHSQYPPPYSNPYSQPQHNQAPPQSSHAYPYWTYI